MRTKEILIGGCISAIAGIFVFWATEGFETLLNFSSEDEVPSVIYQQPPVIYQLPPPIIYQPAQNTVTDPCESNVWNNWKTVKSHAGEVTDAMDEVLRFLKVSAMVGCTGRTYTLLVNKQNIGEYVVTLHEPYPNNGFRYRNISTTLEVNGKRGSLIKWLFRSPMNSNDWELIKGVGDI